VSEAYPLIGRTEQLLQGIENFTSKISIKKLESDLTYFLNTYRTFYDNLKKLDQLRDEIEFRGGVSIGHRPSPLGSTTFRHPWLGETPPSEVGHLMRYAKIRSLRVSVVKASIDRLRAALAAHRLALNHLIEYCTLLCGKCGKVNRSRAAIQLLKENAKCSNCGFNEFIFAPNDAGIFRLELIPYIPFAGDYMRRIAQLPSFGRATYAKIIRYLRESVGTSVRSASVIVRVQVGNRIVRRRFRFSAEKEGFAECEKIVREHFGPNARIESVHHYRTRSVLLNDRYTRACLGIAYTSLVYDTWITRAKSIGLPEALATETILLKLPLYVLVHDIARYFLLKLPKSRRRFSGIFPHLQVSPPFDQLEPILSILEDREVALTAEMLQLTRSRISPSTIHLKLLIEREFEARLKKLGPISSRGLAAATLYLSSDLNLQNVCNTFNTQLYEVKTTLQRLAELNVEEKLNEEGRKKLALMEAPRTARAQKFIKAIEELP